MHKVHYFNFCRDTRKSIKVAQRALRLVELFYGPDDEDAKLLRDFLKKYKSL